MPLDLDSLLNAEQARAAKNIAGPSLIIAGAGSGKTRMITYRIANMIENGIRSENILALTFTNKAAREMQERIKAIIGKKADNLKALTFHSFGLGILKHYIHHLGYHNNFTLYDENDNYSLIKQCVTLLGFDKMEFDIKELRTLFSAIKTGQKPLESVHQSLALIYNEWKLSQKAYNVVDFDDLIVLPIELFKTKGFVLNEVRERFTHILVDEFQDTSLLQYEELRLLAERSRNLCVVGDDDQSIYSWRGANYLNIEYFERDFPERKEFKLERNYRSSGNILYAANQVIALNTNRKSKNLWTEDGKGALIVIKHHQTPIDEARSICRDIRFDIREKRLNFSDFAVLVRTNSQMREIENAATEANLPVKISGGTSFFDKKEVRDFLCYLKAIVNEKDDASLLRIINTPSRGIGRVTVEKLRRYADEKCLSLFEAINEIVATDQFPSRSREALKAFAQNLTAWKKSIDHPAMLIDKIKQDIGYEAYIAAEGPTEKAVLYRLNNIKYLSERLSRYIKENENATLRDYLNIISIVSDDGDNRDNKINLMTIHASKGLEFTHVYLAGMDNHHMPSARALKENPKSIEEERRLFYVAITRAKEKLVISYATEHENAVGEISNYPPSQFISTIPKDVQDNEEEKSPEELRAESLKRFSALKERFKRNLGSK